MASIQFQFDFDDCSFFVVVLFIFFYNFTEIKIQNRVGDERIPQKQNGSFISLFFLNCYSFWFEYRYIIFKKKVVEEEK